MAGSNNGPGHNYLSRRAVIKHLPSSCQSAANQIHIYQLSRRLLNGRTTFRNPFSATETWITFVLCFFTIFSTVLIRLLPFIPYSFRIQRRKSPAQCHLRLVHKINTDPVYNFVYLIPPYIRCLPQPPLSVPSDILTLLLLFAVETNEPMLYNIFMISPRIVHDSRLFWVLILLVPLIKNMVEFRELRVMYEKCTR